MKALLADPAGAARGRERLAAIEETLHAARSPLDQAAVELAAANWLLAMPTASPTTRWIIGLLESGDLPRIHENAIDAQKHLERARTLLKEEHEEAKDRRRELRATAATLEAFARLLAVCSDKSDAPGYKQACEDAAVGLASARESEKAQIAAAAVMWQSLAWVSAGRSERALSTLPDPLSKPEQLPFDFASRLLRCRVLAESGQPAAALALLMHIQSICEDWFPQQDKESIESRRRLIGILQWNITHDWLGALRARSPEAARGVESTLSSARESINPKRSSRLAYHVEMAVPILIEAPALRSGLENRPPASAPVDDRSQRDSLGASAPAVQ